MRRLFFQVLSFYGRQVLSLTILQGAWSIGVNKKNYKWQQVSNETFIFLMKRRVRVGAP